MLYLPRIPRDALLKHWHGIVGLRNARIYGMPRISLSQRASLKIGRNFKGTSSWRHNTLGAFQPLTLKTTTPEANIIIGDNVGISSSTLSARDSITIGNHVLIGAGCLLSDTDAHPTNAIDRRENKKPNSAPILIEDDVFIGTRSIILKGVTLGERTIVGAGSVVTTSFPPDSVIAGNPARSIKPSSGT